MSAEEVGQYILLICHAWMAGKDASLPNNPALLAKYARTEKVSDLVMSKWKPKEPKLDGRLYNVGLSREWAASINRYDEARENGIKGGLSRSEAKINAARENGRLGGRPRKEEPNRTQSISDQIIPNHIIPNQTSFPGGSFENGNFKFISTHYRAAFRKDLARTKQNHEEYASACNTYGEDIILEKFDEWAKDNQWIASHPKGGNRLFVFLQSLPVIIEGDKLAQERRATRSKPVQLSERNPFEEEVDPDAPTPEFIEANKNRAF